MKYLIGNIFVFLLLVGAFFAPAILSIDTSLSLEPGIAVAQGAEDEAFLVDESKGFWDYVNPAYDPTVFLLKTVGAIFITVGAMFLWLTGILLNYAIAFSILNFDIFATITGVPIAWTVLRDITNVFFIFIFLATGIATILGLQNYGAKKIIPLLLVIAVLINFSLFFTKVGIDVAHGFAGAILNQSGVAGNSCDLALTGGNANGLVGQGVNRVYGNLSCFLTHGVAAAFIEQFGFIDYFGESLGGAFNSGQGEAYSADTIGEGFRAMFFGIFAFIFMSAASIVFLGGAVILIIRIVKLVILMITSAPAMAAYILPGTRRFWNSWFEEFIREVFFAPIFLLLIALSLLFLNTARGALVGNGDLSFATIFIHGGVSTVSLIMYFLIALGFLFMSIKLAQDMKVSGAKTAMGIQKWGQGIAGRTAIGLPARNIQRVYNRAISRAPSAVRGTLRTIGVDQAVTDTLDSAQTETFGSNYSVRNLEAAGRQRTQTITGLQTQDALRTAAEAGDQVEVNRLLQRMSDAQIAALDSNTLALDAVAQNLTPAQLRRILERDELSQDDRNTILNNRFAELTQALNNATTPGASPADITQGRQAVRGLANAEIEVAPRQHSLSEFASQNYSGRQADHIMQSDRFTRAEKDTFRQQRFQNFERIAAADRPADAVQLGDMMRNYSTEEIANMDEAVLSRAGVAANLTRPVLQRIQENRSLPETHRNRIANTLLYRANHGDTEIRRFLTTPAGMYWQVATP